MYPINYNLLYWFIKELKAVTSVSFLGNPSRRYFLGPYKDRKRLSTFIINYAGYFCFESMHFLISTAYGDPAFSSYANISAVDMYLNLNLSTRNWATLNLWIGLLWFGSSRTSSKQPNKSFLLKIPRFIDIHATTSATHCKS